VGIDSQKPLDDRLSANKFLPFSRPFLLNVDGASRGYQFGGDSGEGNRDSELIVISIPE
jgi:hypothetical protein